MASKKFKVTPEGYQASITHRNGHRVISTLWKTIVTFDKDLNVLDVESTSGKEETTQQDVKDLTTYSKNQVKKLNQEVKTGMFYVNDVYGSGYCIKEVKLKANGEPNLKDAGNRVSSYDLKPLTPKIEKEVQESQKMKQEIQDLEMKLNKMKQEYTTKMQQIFYED